MKAIKLMLSAALIYVGLAAVLLVCAVLFSLPRLAYGSDIPPKTQTLKGPGAWTITKDGAVPISDSRIHVPPVFTAPQEQASNLAVPQPGQASLVSVMTVILCNNVIWLGGIDAEGVMHPVNLDGAGREQVMKVMQLVPADHVIGVNVGCPTDASKDTTVL